MDDKTISCPGCGHSIPEGVVCPICGREPKAVAKDKGKEKSEKA